MAAGKGVTVANNSQEAVTAIQECLEHKAFGDAGNKVVIEEFLTGEEASFIVLTDGKRAIPLASSQDHKTRDNQDKGPNTGGMGAYSPAPIITKSLHKEIMDKVIYPTIQGMSKEGISYQGFLSYLFLIVFHIYRHSHALIHLLRAHQPVIKTDARILVYSHHQI